MDNFILPDAIIEEIPLDDIWADIIASENAAHKEEMKLKEWYKRKLKPLINTHVLWKFLDDHDHWEPKGIVALRIYDKHNGYYNRIMPHAQILDERFRHLELNRQTEYKSEVGANHIFIQQFCSYEDCYNGYIAIPLSNREYFLISYSC